MSDLAVASGGVHVDMLSAMGELKLMESHEGAERLLGVSTIDGLAITRAPCEH